MRCDASSVDGVCSQRRREKRGQCSKDGGSRLSNENGVKPIEKAVVSDRLFSLLPVVFSGKTDG
jgi:hypothetical protein